MKVRVTINGEGANTYVIDTSQIKDQDLADAIQYTLKGPSQIGHMGKFGPYEVIHGEIHQEGYTANEELSNLDIPDGIPEIYINTSW